MGATAQAYTEKRELPRDEVDYRTRAYGGDAQPLLRHADGLGRPVHLQQFALYRLGYGRQGADLVLLGHGVFQCVLGLHGFGVPVAGTACSQNGYGDQAEMIFFM